jgi:hypothetical protein
MRGLDDLLKLLRYSLILIISLMIQSMYHASLEKILASSRWIQLLLKIC